MDAWVQLADPNEIRMPQGHPYDFGVVLGMSRLIRAHPRIGRAFSALFAEIMFSPEGCLSRREREMVAAVAASAQDCTYWTQSHAEFLRVEDGDPALVEAIKEKRWREISGLTEREAALCTVAEKLSAAPTRMIEEDWQPLRDLGFDDQGLLEVAHIVGVFNHLTRLADGFGLALDEPTRRAGESGVALRRIE